jgi:hypothetical protein
VFAPHDLASAASECSAEAHVGSYLVGPPQYYRAPGVVPGLDFESHYGIGHALAFSRVMGNGGLQSVLQRYILFVLLISVAYFLSAHLVLTDWLRSPWAAFAVTLGLAAAAAEGLAYTMPSCWPVRHPFCFAFLFCAVRGIDSRNWCLAAGAAAGLSLFWQTDTGLYTLAAGAALYAASAVFLGGSWRRAPVFLAAGAGTFLALCLGFFGPRVLSLTFAERLLEPLLLYATGFGTALMEWHGGWGWWYNLAGPGVAVASVGVFVGCGRRGAPREVAYGAAASLLGLAMLFKWVNRSIDVLWALNGGLVLAAAGWWACVAWRSLAAKLEHPTRRALAATALLVLLVLGVWADAHFAKPDPLLRSTSPLVRIADRLDTYPNLINALRRPIEPFEVPPPFDEQAVAYLRDHTAETERVAVVSQYDWEFLAAAGRAPRLCWLQLFLVHSPVLLDRCADDLRNSDRVFVERHALISLLQVNPATHARVASILAGCFEPADESARWTLYRRKPGK